MSSVSAKLVARNMAKFRQELGSADKTRKKAGETAVRVEAFRLRKVLQDEIHMGAPGGKKFKPTRVITRLGGRRRSPLRALKKAVRYFFVTDSSGNKTFHIGFGGPKLSQSWIKIAKRSQEGASVSADQKFAHSTPREFLRRFGAKLREAGRRKISTYFFLRRSTTKLETQPRPIIDPFWDAHKMEAWKNIKSNFNRKLAGERI